MPTDEATRDALAAITAMAQRGIDDMLTAIRYLRSQEDPEASRIATSLVPPRILLAKINGLALETFDLPRELVE